MGDDLQYKSYWRAFFCKMGGVLLLLSVARLLFFCCNHDFFKEESQWNVIKSFIVGVRFDIATLAIFNAPFWIAWTLPISCRSNKFINFFLNVGYFISNGIMLILNIIDAKYFMFTFRRMGGEILTQRNMLTEDISIYVDMIIRFWYVAAAGLLIIVILLLLSLIKMPRVCIRLRDYCYFLISILCLIVCVRGGFQNKPLKPVDCNIYAPSHTTSVLVNNAAFNVFHTRLKASLPEWHFFDDDICQQYYSAYHRPQHDKHPYFGMFAGKNVMIIILESFSAEHIGALDRQFKPADHKGFTPFLDSLISKSYVLDGFANGTVSIDGLTSILTSIPPLFESLYITSAYAGNTIDSLPKMLKNSGYETMFFYGGKPNSCNFGSLVLSTGIDKNYCQYDYDGPSSDIVGWGVYDEQFFQFAARKINEAKQPFFATLFTLSSHHPYVYPEHLHGKFPRGSWHEPLEELIGYTDYSLKKFFETAEQMDWYKNTIFVIVADHIAGAQQPYYQKSVGGYSIPIMFYDPNGVLVGRPNTLAQQIDIMPSVLDLLGINDSYFSFGQSVFDQTVDRFVISYKNGIYQLITDDFVIKFDGENVIGLYSRDDVLLSNNLINDSTVRDEREKLETFLKAILHHYSDSLRKNRMQVVD